MYESSLVSIIVVAGFCTGVLTSSHMFASAAFLDRYVHDPVWRIGSSIGSRLGAALGGTRVAYHCAVVFGIPALVFALALSTRSLPPGRRTQRAALLVSGVSWWTSVVVALVEHSHSGLLLGDVSPIFLAAGADIAMMGATALLLSGTFADLAYAALAGPVGVFVRRWADGRTLSSRAAAVAVATIFALQLPSIEASVDDGTLIPSSAERSTASAYASMVYIVISYFVCLALTVPRRTVLGVAWAVVGLFVASYNVTMGLLLAIVDVSWTRFAVVEHVV